MIQKIKNWWRTRRAQSHDKVVKNVYTRDEVLAILAEAREMAYNDGKRDGLTIAREQATKSLKEILWQQNNPSRTK